MLGMEDSVLCFVDCRNFSGVGWPITCIAHEALDLRDFLTLIHSLVRSYTTLVLFRR
jgi:hypothetical protein